METLGKSKDKMLHTKSDSTEHPTSTEMAQQREQTGMAAKKLLPWPTTLQFQDLTLITQTI